ncbi:MAG: hypothetical protein AB3N16_07135, partial [Flavobacteriaceae bacterium]
MIDELELLKKDWKKKEAELPQLSQTEINKMIGGKSRSIVKWILIISILEFTLPQLLYFIPGIKNGWDFYNQIGIKEILVSQSVLMYLVALFFMYLFYKRYKDISVLDNT